MRPIPLIPTRMMSLPRALKRSYISKIVES